MHLESIIALIQRLVHEFIGPHADMKRASDTLDAYNEFHEYIDLLNRSEPCVDYHTFHNSGGGRALYLFIQPRYGTIGTVLTCALTGLSPQIIRAEFERTLEATS